MNEVRAIARHRFFIKLAGVGAVFAWVGLFASVAWATSDVRTGFVVTVLSYALSHLIVFWCAPLVGPHVHEGVRRLLVLGTLMFSIALAYAGTLFLVPRDATEFLWGALMFAVVWGLYRVLYAIPYRPHSEMGMQKSNSWWEILFIFAPFVFGLCAAVFSFSWLLGAVSLIALMSLVPLSRLSESYESFSWGIGETYLQLFLPHNRSFVVHAFALGCERAVLFVVWPLMILMLSQSLVVFGAIMSLTLLATFMLKGVMKRLFAYLGTHRSASVATATAVSVWVVRGLAASPGGVIFTQIVSSALPHSRHTVSDEFVYIDEYSILREMASALGVIFSCVLAIILTLAVSFGMVLFYLCIFAGLTAGYAAWYAAHSEPLR